MHSGAVPIAFLGFAVPFEVDSVFFAKPQEEIAGYPHVIGAFFGAFGKELEFGLRFGDFEVDAFVVDAGFQAKKKVRVDNFSGVFAYVFVADAAVVFALRRRESAGLARPMQGSSSFKQEVLLLQAEPGFGIVDDGGPHVGEMGRAVRVFHFAHYQKGVVVFLVQRRPAFVLIERDRFEHAVRVASFGLLRGAAVKSPLGTIRDGFGSVADHFGLSTKVLNGLIAVQPNVFEFVFRHTDFCCVY